LDNILIGHDGEQYGVSLIFFFLSSKPW